MSIVSPPFILCLSFAGPHSQRSSCAARIKRLQREPNMDFETLSQIQRQFNSVFAPGARAPPRSPEDDSHNDEDAGMASMAGEGNNTDASDNETSTTNAENDDEHNNIQRLRAPFPERGKTILSNRAVRVIVQEVAHRRYTRFNVGDHLYSVRIVPRGRSAPLLLNIEKSLQRALTNVLDDLKQAYPSQADFQVYLTIIGNGIKNGLNSGN